MCYCKSLFIQFLSLPSLISVEKAMEVGTEQDPTPLNLVGQLPLQPFMDKSRAQLIETIQIE